MVLLLSDSFSALDPLLVDFMLLSLSTLLVDLSFSTKEVEGPGMGGVEGVFDPEEGASVHIFSLSLSDSSPLTLTLVDDLWRWVEGIVKEAPASGLFMRPSE